MLKCQMLKTLWGILIKAIEGFVTKIIMIAGDGFNLNVSGVEYREAGELY